MKKIVVLLGSGRRNGNTEQLVDAFIRGAEEADHTVKKISLYKTQINGCLGCNACRFGKPCVQKDDFNSIVPDLKACDMIVFASPLLFLLDAFRQNQGGDRKTLCFGGGRPKPSVGALRKELAEGLRSAHDLCG